MLMLIFYSVLCFWYVANGVRAPVYADLGKGNGDELAGMRESIASMKSDIESLKHRKRVSMVACLKGSFTASGTGSVLQILDIKTIYGITPSSQYRNGIFTCKDRGLYMVFATVTSTIQTSFKIMRNKTSVSRGFIGGNSGHYSSGSSIAFVQLDEKDQISIQADKQMTIGDRSCFGVIKID
ncbi:COL10A [Mytilus edulis]|uniref:COL10A n=1 Tax=Mytilus edulis TaxID=6550 RepID=A0A8S3TXX3_MYTED|nr:COL10A [Mytilus edulis]